MKSKLITAGVVLLVLAGVTAFNMYVEKRPITLAEKKDSEEVEKKLAENDAEDGETVVPKGEPAPDVYKAKFETTKGDFVIEVHKEWAPLGAQQFHELVKAGFYDNNRLFRMVPGFVVQWGINGDPEVNKKWEDRRLPDDTVTQSNKETFVSFASGGPNTRTTQVFINLGDNTQLDHYQQGFPPFGKVIEGMDVVNSFNSKYKDGPTGEQAQMMQLGNSFTDMRFPGLDAIKKATIVP